ncbi:hypothetical protein Tco_0321185 [Tanacetum coccineum]
MIGSLLYLTASRPDIMFSVYLCARLQEDPKTSHLEAVKCIFRYIKVATHLGLWYPEGTGIEAVVYVDSDHAGDYVDRKSTSGIFTFVGCCLTSWFSKKQTALAISTTEAEYVSIKKTCQQALWMKQALIDYDIQLDDVLIMCDNKGAIDLSKNPMQHSQGAIDLSKNSVQHLRTKHVEIRHHFLRDNVQKGHISIKKVSGQCSFTDKWSLEDLQYSVPTSGPYQTNPPCPDEIKNYVQEEREGLVTRIRHDVVINVEENQFLTREIVSVMKTWVEIIRENVFCLGTRKDYGTRRGRSSTSSPSAFGQPSSSHLNNDDNDGNDEGTLRASTPSPTLFVNSLTNEVPRVFSNPPNIDPNMEPFYTRQTKILNRQLQLRNEQRGGIRSIRKGIKNL